MTVQELFEKADAENVFYAYTLVEPVFDDMDKHTILEKTLALKRLKEHIKNVCNEIATCEICIQDEPLTLFVIGRTQTAWGESYKQDLECFTIEDKAAMDAVNKNFTLWNNDGDIKLTFHGIDFDKLTVLAGYTIAKPSVLELGIDVCCAVILDDLFLWGFTAEQREESYKNLEDCLKMAEEDQDCETLSHEELCEELEIGFFSKATEDEKEHYRLEQEYQDSVRDIENRYKASILEQDHKRFIDLVRDEYSGRTN